ncbi:MAG: hypothetical protein AB1410_04775 [Acidobacteriota bacterium]
MKKLYLISALIISLIILFIYGNVLSSVSANLLKKEMEDKALLAAQYLASANKNPLINKDFLSLDTESVKTYSFVKEAFVMDENFQTLAPISKRGETDVKAKEAYEQKKEIMPKENNIYSIYIPIYKDRSIFMGIVRLDYSQEQIVASISNISRVKFLMLIFLLFISIILFYFAFRFVTKPLKDLNNEIELVLKQEGKFLKETPDPDLSFISITINRLLRKR